MSEVKRYIFDPESGTLCEYHAPTDRHGCYGERVTVTSRYYREADYAALQARLDTAERERDDVHTRGYKMGLDDAHRCEQHTTELKAKLAHLTRLVEGLPVDAINRVTNEVNVQEDMSEPERYDQFLQDLRSITDALAALLEHRRGMNGGKL